MTIYPEGGAPVVIPGAHILGVDCASPDVADETVVFSLHTKIEAKFKWGTHRLEMREAMNRAMGIPEATLRFSLNPNVSVALHQAQLVFDGVTGRLQILAKSMRLLWKHFALELPWRERRRQRRLVRRRVTLDARRRERWRRWECRMRRSYKL